jgi:hypothetical protein
MTQIAQNYADKRHFFVENLTKRAAILLLLMRYQFYEHRRRRKESDNFAKIKVSKRKDCGVHNEISIVANRVTLNAAITQTKQHKHAQNNATFRSIVHYTVDAHLCLVPRMLL